MDHDDEKILSMLKRYRPSGPPPELKERIFHSPHRPHYRMWLPIAASILLVAGVGLIWRQLMRPAESIDPQAKIAQIRSGVVRTGRAEQLLAVANILAAQRGGEDHAKQIYYEVAKEYPNFKSRALDQLGHKFPSERRTE